MSGREPLPLKHSSTWRHFAGYRKTEAINCDNSGARARGRVLRGPGPRQNVRPEGGIEPLRFSAPTGLKPATRTTECHLDTGERIKAHFEFQ